jgi:hypothetical protein
VGLCRNGNELFVTGIGQVFGKRSNEIVCSDRALLDRISNGNRLIAGGDGCALIFRKGETICKVPENEAVDRLMAEIENL